MKSQKEIYEALLEGKILIHYGKPEPEVFLDENGNLSNGGWIFLDVENWSIKPEPLEFWVNVHANLTHAVEVFTTEGDAEIHAKYSKVKTIKVREVME